MNQELKTALFAAEAVAHMRGYEREILPLADLARGMDARITELEAALSALLDSPVDGGILTSDAIGDAFKVLARPIEPLTPGDLIP
jgi:hypothetical protein